MIIPPADRLNRIEEYYFSKKLNEIRQLNQKGYDILNLGVGSPDLMPSDSTIRALTESANNPKNHGYQPYTGIPQLRKAFAEWYRKLYNVILDPESEILPLMGSKEGITHISLAFLNPGDKVLVPELGYPAYRAVSLMVGASPVEYPLKEGSWHPDFQQMEKMDLAGTKIMWINYPHMPTGAPPSAELFQKITDFATRHKILIAHDNPYGLILNEMPPLSVLSAEGARDVAIEMNSMSKSHNMAGWRIGWINGRKDYLAMILKIKSNFDSGMFRGLQDAAVEAMNNPEEWHEERNNVYRERRQLVWQMLDQLKCTYRPGQVGMFIWARIPDEVKNIEKWVDHIMYNHKVFLTPGHIFGEKGRRFIRVSLCADKNVFSEAINRLKNLNYTEQ
jgi:aspartate/methionine/tyrosine aminotransferase